MTTTNIFKIIDHRPPLLKVSDFEEVKNGLLTVANHTIYSINLYEVKDQIREN